MAQRDVHDETPDSAREALGPGSVSSERGPVSGGAEFWSLLDVGHRDCGCSLADGQHLSR